MKPESRLEIARRRVCEAEALVERQARHVAECQKAGLPSQDGLMMLALLHSALQAFRDALDMMDSQTD